MAKECGSVKAANMIILGAASPYLGLKPQSIENAIRTLFKNKGEEMIELNLKAKNAGLKYVTENS